MARTPAVLDDLQLPDRYQPLRHLATGGMASVWCAHDRVLGRRVAIKLLAERFAGNSAAVERFEREARAAARLSGHPHVVTIYDVDQAAEGEGPRAFIVMEYLAGGTVADALRLGAVGREEAIHWLREAAAALDYAHRRGVLHRDIKPANLLLDRGRTVHVGDFGIARVGSEDPVTSAGQVLGTAAYLAPERALGHPAAEASDRYSLAVAAFELLVGQRPFTARHFAVQARQHVEDDPPAASGRNPALPSAVDAVLSRGMAKRAEDRWPSAGAFADALEAALSDAPVPVRRGRTVAPAPLPLPRGNPVAPAPLPRRCAVAPAPVRVHSTARRPRRALAVGALAATAFGLGLTIGAGNHGGTPHARLAAAAAPPVSSAPRHIAPPPKPRPAPHVVTSSTATASDVAATPAADTTPAPSADALEARGHALMEAGQYGAAIPVLRQALADASPASPTYAYALFDLGHSLRMAGDPTAAAQVLYQRLQIPNQTDVVRHELQLTLLALGQSQRSGGAPAGPPDHHKNHISGHIRHKSGPDHHHHGD